MASRREIALSSQAGLGDCRDSIPRVLIRAVTRVGKNGT